MDEKKMCRGQSPKVTGEMVAEPDHQTPYKFPNSKMRRGAHDVKLKVVK